MTIYDNVRLQHQLVTEKLGIERLRLVTGFSMGACQAFQWAAQFPDMVRAACPIAGSARTGNYNKVFLLALRRALELDPAYADGFYDRPPVNGLKAFAAIYAGWGTSEPFFREEEFRPLGSRSTEEHVADFWEPFFLRCDANNLLSQLWTWEAGDISANPTYGGNFAGGAGRHQGPHDHRAGRQRPLLPARRQRRTRPATSPAPRSGGCLGLGPHGADEPGRHPGDRRPAEGAAGRLNERNGRQLPERLTAWPEDALEIRKPSMDFTSGRCCQRAASCRMTRFARSPPICLVHLVDGLQLFPDAADGVVERDIDAVMVVARELAARIDAVAGDHPPAGGVSMRTNCWPIVWPLPSRTWMPGSTLSLSPSTSVTRCSIEASSALRRLSGSMIAVR